MKVPKEIVFKPYALSIKDAVRYCGLPQTTMYALLKEHQVAYFEKGRRKLVDRASLEKFLAKSRVGTMEEIDNS